MQDEEIQSKKSPKDKLLKKVRSRYKIMTEADRENRDDAMEDIKFVNVPGYQWDMNMKQERGDRPCYEFNKLRINGKKVINEIRANRPAGKVRGVEGNDVKTAEVFEGLIRNICNVSDMDTIVDYAAQYQVDGGMGAWRITTDYIPMTFDEQDIKIEPIHNPFCLYADPASKDLLKRDAMDWVLTEKIPKSQFKQRWPKAKVTPFESTEFDDEDDWMDDETIRICEYWYKEKAEKEIWQLSDGKVIDSEAEGSEYVDQTTIVKRRITEYYKIKMCIASGNEILEEADWAGSMFPFVIIYGEYVVIDGKIHWCGLHRYAKDAQRSYNVSRTSIDESIAMSPQAKFWATSGQAKGHTDQWSEAHRKNFPFLLYTPDPKAPGVPQKMGGADVPVALIQQTSLASSDIDATQGIFGDDRGERTHSQSGRAVLARAEQGRVSTFNFPDNIGKGIQRTWEILVDLIPKIYDTEKEVRILGADGAEDYVKINTMVQDKDTGEMIALNDLNTGRYDVTITIGPSFSTRRQEAAEMYSQMGNSNPQIWGIAGDLIMKSIDLPYADEIAERWKSILPPEIQQKMTEGKDIPPEAQAAMAQANQAMQQVQMMMQQAQEAAQVAKEEQFTADKDKAQVDTAIANLQTEQARFEADIAKELANIATKNAQLDQKAAQMNLNEFNQQKEQFFEQDKQLFTEQMAQSIQAINEMAQSFAHQAADALDEIRSRPKPRVKKVTAIRQQGQLIAVPEYED